MIEISFINRTFFPSKGAFFLYFSHWYFSVSYFESWQVNREAKSLYDMWRPIIWKIGSVEHDWQNNRSTDRCWQLVISLLMTAIYRIIQQELIACYCRDVAFQREQFSSIACWQCWSSYHWEKKKNMCAGVPKKINGRKMILLKITMCLPHGFCLLWQGIKDTDLFDFEFQYSS